MYARGAFTNYDFSGLLVLLLFLYELPTVQCVRSGILKWYFPATRRPVSEAGAGIHGTLDSLLSLRPLESCLISPGSELSSLGIRSSPTLLRTCFLSVCWNFLVNHTSVCTGRKLGFPGLRVGWDYRGPQRFFVVGNLEAEVGSTCLNILFTWRLLPFMYIPTVDGELLTFWKNG